MPKTKGRNNNRVCYDCVGRSTCRHRLGTLCQLEFPVKRTSRDGKVIDRYIDIGNYDNSLIIRRPNL